MKKTCLLLGSFGQTNIGDDILLFNCLAFLEKFRYDKIYVNANLAENVPIAIKQKFMNVIFIETYRTSIFRWLVCLFKADHIFYGGGTVFKELYKTTGRSKYAVIFRVLVFNFVGFIFRKKIINLYIGIGSIKTWFGRFIIKYCLLFSTLTIFRDKISFEFTKYALKLPAKKIFFSTDGLFLNKIWQQEWENFEHEKISDGRFTKIIGVNLLSDIPDWINREAYLQAVCDFLDFLTGCNYLIVLIPFQNEFNANNDYCFMKNFIVPRLSNQENIILLNKVDLPRLHSLYGLLDYFIGMRFHSLLLSLINQIPFIGIEYDTKCSRFIKENAYAYSVQLEDISKNELINKFLALNENKGQVSESLKKISEKYYKNIFRSYNPINEILNYEHDAIG